MLVDMVCCFIFRVLCGSLLPHFFRHSLTIVWNADQLLRCAFGKAHCYFVILSMVNSIANMNTEGIPLLWPPEVKNIIGKNIMKTSTTVIT